MLPMSKQPSGGFSIDSIINTTRRETSREDSPLSRNNVDNPRPNLGTRSELSAINGRIPPLHPALPLHVRNLLLAGETTRSLPPDVFHYGQSWPLHNSSLPSISTLARSLPQYTEPCLNAGFPGLWPQVSEQMAFLNPWLVTRGTQSLLGLPLGMLFVFLLVLKKCFDTQYRIPVVIQMLHFYKTEINKNTERMIIFGVFCLKEEWNDNNFH